jgi:predicted acylesterase/phospholipase RssA
MRFTSEGRDYIFMNLDHAVFGGGSMHGFMYLGAIIGFVNNRKDVFEQWQSKLKAVAGTSIGSLFAYLITLWDPWQILEFMKTAGFKGLHERFFDQNWESVRAEACINSGKEVDVLLQRGVAQSFGQMDATLKDHYDRTGIVLIVTVTEACSGHTHYWSHKNMPHFPIWKALRASISLPYVFPAFQLGQNKFIDGGVTCNIPCHLFPARRTLVLYVQSRRPDTVSPQTLVQLYANAAQLGCFRTKRLYALNCIPCVSASDSVSAYNFGASNDQLNMLVRQGILSYNAVILRNKLLVYITFISVVLSSKQTSCQ